MAIYQLGSPNGWMGDSFEADTDTDAEAWAIVRGEVVLDLVDWRDEDNNPVILLVVADGE
jgi:hypothetical protein